VSERRRRGTPYVLQPGLAAFSQLLGNKVEAMGFKPRLNPERADFRII
jgi:hypothetical protein